MWSGRPRISRVGEPTDPPDSPPTVKPVTVAPVKFTRSTHGPVLKCCCGARSSGRSSRAGRREPVRWRWGRLSSHCPRSGIKGRFRDLAGDGQCSTVPPDKGDAPSH